MADFDELFGGETTPAETSKDDWRVKREQQRKEVEDLLEKATVELRDPDKFRKYLDVQSRFDRYSANNAILISAQNPDATKLADFNKWKEAGVNIQKGEKTISILEPGRSFTRPDGSTGMYFNVKKVFDISQTTAEPKPENKRPSEKLLIKSLMKTSPVPILISNMLNPETNAMYSPQEDTIFVRQGLSGDEIFRSLVHEIAKARAVKDGIDTKSIYVDCVAYITCKRNGVECDTVPDTAGFGNLEPKDTQKFLKAVRDETNSMTAVMEKILHPKERDAR